MRAREIRRLAPLPVAALLLPSLPEPRAGRRAGRWYRVGRAHCEVFRRPWQKEATSGPSAAELFANVRARTAAVFVVEGEGPLPLLEELRSEDLVFVGSAFVCGENTLATCAHLFEGRWPAARARGVALRFGEGDWTLATLQGAATGVDVAVLRLREPKTQQATPALQFSAQLPRQGDRVAVCGMTQFGNEVVGLSGLVSQPRQSFRGLAEDPATRFVQLALPTLPGMSGSPVLDADGKVVAMVAKKFEEHGLALPAERVQKVVTCLEAGYVWRPPTLGLEVQESGTLLNPTVVVKAVRGKGALLAGVQVGDEILAIGEFQVANLLSMREALSDLGDPRGGEPSLRLKLRRGGKLLEVRLAAERAAARAQDYVATE